MNFSHVAFSLTISSFPPIYVSWQCCRRFVISLVIPWLSHAVASYGVMCICGLEFLIDSRKNSNLVADANV